VKPRILISSVKHAAAKLESSVTDFPQVVVVEQISSNSGANCFSLKHPILKLIITANLHGCFPQENTSITSDPNVCG